MYARSVTQTAETAQESERRDENLVAGSFVRSLRLSGFRNYPSLFLDLSERPQAVVLTGRNGAGKTNLLESVSFLAAGKGLRQAKFADVVCNDGASRGWDVRAVLSKGDDEFDVMTGFAADKGNETKRRVKINGIEKRSQADLSAVCEAVWLTPSMDRLFSADPSGRRRFLDRLVQPFFKSHAGDCAAYAQAFKQWSALIRDGNGDGQWLTSLEKTMGKYGAKMSAARRSVVAMLNKTLDGAENEAFPRAALELTGGAEDVLKTADVAESAALIAEKMQRARSVYAQSGLCGGVHTVDLKAVHRTKKAEASACSTGEQKALLVSVLLAHLKAQAAETGTLALLLLDEVGAHLDASRRDALFDELTRLNTQVWLTGTEAGNFEVLKRTARFVAVEDLSRDAPDWAAAS